MYIQDTDETVSTPVISRLFFTAILLSNLYEPTRYLRLTAISEWNLYQFNLHKFWGYPEVLIPPKPLLWDIFNIILLCKSRSSTVVSYF